MKTFEQYIKETANFRLGESTNRGENHKLFQELDNTDNIYSEGDSRVSEYVYEGTNFIFGGKAGLTGKEYNKKYKLLSELEIGDMIYFYNFEFHPSTLKVIPLSQETVEIVKITKDHKATFLNVKNIDTKIHRLYSFDDDKMDVSIDVYRTYSIDGTHKKGFNVYATYEESVENVIEFIKNKFSF